MTPRSWRPQLVERVDTLFARDLAVAPGALVVSLGKVSVQRVEHLVPAGKVDPARWKVCSTRRRLLPCWASTRRAVVMLCTITAAWWMTSLLPSVVETINHQTTLGPGEQRALIGAVASRWWKSVDWRVPPS